MNQCDRLLDDFTRRLPYRSTMEYAKTVNHWGQRKLLLSEIEFLTEHANEHTIVIYAGAAPGTHIQYLSRELFPKIKFVLVDPSPFSIRETEKIEIINELFTVNNVLSSSYD